LEETQTDVSRCEPFCDGSTRVSSRSSRRSRRLEVAGDFYISGTIQIDAMWTVLFTAAAALYVTLRTLKRRTKLLYVEGR